MGYLKEAWTCPDRYREQTRAHRPQGPHEREYASSAALRLMLRVARIPGVGALLKGKALEELPVQDALAWAVADDELNGAHHMSAETDGRFREAAERRKARNQSSQTEPSNGQEGGGKPWNALA